MGEHIRQISRIVSSIIVAVGIVCNILQGIVLGGEADGVDDNAFLCQGTDISVPVIRISPVVIAVRQQHDHLVGGALAELLISHFQAIVHISAALRAGGRDAIFDRVCT